MRKRVSMATRTELIEAVGTRYREAAPNERTRILDEFVALTGYHRKHAIRVLRSGALVERSRPARDRVYDEAVRQALIVLWEAGDRICAKRLKALLPVLLAAMERHGHLDLDSVVKQKLLQISAATIDRLLAGARSHVDSHRKRRAGVGVTIRQSIPVRTFADWGDPPPGFFEIDMVEHCGGAKTDGDLFTALSLPTLPVIGPSASRCRCAINRSSSKRCPPRHPICHSRCSARIPTTIARLSIKLFSTIAKSAALSRRVHGRTGKTIRPGSSKKTVPWCVAL